MATRVVLTLAYFLAIVGSCGMIALKRFPLSSNIDELRYSMERFCGLDGSQLWMWSWVLILLSGALQLISVWLPVWGWS